MDIEVRGRTTGESSDLRSRVKIQPGSVIIRVDDNRNDAAWVEAELTVEQLCDLAQEANFMQMERDWGPGVKLAELTRTSSE